MHIAASIFVAVLSTLLGFYFSMRIKNELRQLIEFKNFVIFLYAGIRNGIPVTGIIKTYSQRNESAFSDFFEMLLLRLYNMDSENIAKLWNECVDTAFADIGFDRSLTGFIKELGIYLDYRDIDAKLMCIDSFLEELKLKINEKSTSVNGKSKAYRACGFLIGLMLTVLVI